MAWCEKHALSWDDTVEWKRLLGCPECFADRVLKVKYGDKMPPLGGGGYLNVPKRAEITKDAEHFMEQRNEAIESLADLVGNHNEEVKEQWNPSPALEDLKKMKDHEQIDHMIEVLQAYREGKWVTLKALGLKKDYHIEESPLHTISTTMEISITPETGKDRLINEILALRDKSVGKDESIQLVGVDWLEAIAERIEKGEFDDFLGDA